MSRTQLLFLILDLNSRRYSLSKNDVQCMRKDKNAFDMIAKQAGFKSETDITLIKHWMPNYNRINKNIGICTAAGFRTNTQLLWLVKTETKVLRKKLFRLFAHIYELWENIYYGQKLTKMSTVRFEKAGRLWINLQKFLFYENFWKIRNCRKNLNFLKISVLRKSYM